MIGRRARRAREAMGPAVLALLLVMSLATPFATGLAAAQSFEKTVSGSPEHVVLDLEQLSGEFTLEVETDDAPGLSGSKLLYRETHDASNRDDSIAFGNFGAYENVTLRVSGVSSEPDTGSGSDFNQFDWSGDNLFIHTGGDPGFSCDLDEQIGAIVGTMGQTTDCGYTFPSSETINTTDIDANETKQEIYQSAATAMDAADNDHAVISNRLQDSETVAIANHGQPAYQWSLDKGEGETAAKDNATGAILDYESRIEYNYLSGWNSHVSQMQYLSALAANETGVPSDYVYVGTGDKSDSNHINSTVVGYGTKSYQLQNGTSVDVQTITVESHWEYNGEPTYVDTVEIGPSSGTTESNPDGGSSYWANITGMDVAPPTDTQSTLEALRFENYSQNLAAIDSQTASAVSEMETVVNGTHSEIQAGEINASDIVTPASLLGTYGPGSEYSTYSAALLANIGIGSPEDFEDTGQMNITFEDNSTTRGIVMSRSNPPSGQWEVGTTYDPSTIEGSEFLVEMGENQQIREIGQNFTITNITTNDGEVRTNFTVAERNYRTHSADELIALNQNLSLLRATLEAREDNLNSGVGGGGLLGGGSQGVVILLVAGAVFVVVLSQNGGRR
ncbi:hypothetical protein C475_00565 [Halosimplex carlsbadense 2-9-1]|uniref:Envelope protein N-terminal domain-containing protein n=1 Tax=Halosimplex carlsbadense 2-9-1 TaxID=797114 RepID=M0D8W7_9EURY|nr:hypothetical protein [Halosimplex carlsbadense]ELZ30589.1 hypothetical protein C475_00565 [Halosimplex carlsbadense 2-9-1]